MRIVLSAAGPRSEVFPMFALAGELTRRGHTVTLCVPEKYRSKLMVLEHRMVTCGASFDEYFDGPKAGNTEELLAAIALQIPSQFVAMRDSLREADILVQGGLMLAGTSQAELQKLLIFSVIQTPALLDPEQFPVVGMPLKKGIFHSAKKRRKEWEKKLFPVLNSEREFSHLQKVSDLHRYLYRGGHVLAAIDSSIATLQPSASETVTGFWHFDDSGFSSEDLRAFFADGTAPVLIEPLPVSREEAIEFLEHLCNALSTAGIRAVIHPDWPGADHAKLPAGCAVMQAFPSPQFAAILHPGSAQQFCAAVMAGLPQVTMPALIEQGYWSEKATSLKVGLAGGADASQLATALKEATANPAWKNRVQELAKEMNDQNGLAVAAETIERFGVEAGHGS